jgi:hypothetical protein
MCETSAVALPERLDPRSKPSIYAFYIHFCGTGCLCKGKVAFTAKGTDETGIIILMHIDLFSER